MSRADQQRRPDPRRRRIDTRFTEGELSVVETAAGRRGLPPSAFVRGAALDAATRQTGQATDADRARTPLASGLTPEQVTVLDAARVEIKRVGVLLNQHTRLAHRGVIDHGELAPILHALVYGYQDLIGLLGGKGES